MSDHMRLLLSVQEMDKKLNKYKEDFSNITRQIKMADGLHASAKRLQNAHSYELQCRVKLARTEKEIGGLKSEREELRERIYGGSISNIRELNAIEIEYNHAREKLRKLDRSLNGMKENLEEAERDYAELQRVHNEKKTGWDSKKGDLIKTRDLLGTKYKELKEGHDEQVSSVPKDLLKTYNSLLKSTAGSPIARIIEGVCQGCFIKLPLTDLDVVKKSQNLLRCSTCNRILFFD